MVGRKGNVEGYTEMPVLLTTIAIPGRLTPAAPSAVGREWLEQEVLAVRSSGCSLRNCHPGWFKRKVALNLETIEMSTYK